MKHLVMTEGTTDKALIEVLLERRILKIELEDILDERPFHARQIRGQLIAIMNTLLPEEEITVLRIGDKLTDCLRVSEQIKHRISSIQKYCTKPEFEILLIINEGLFKTFSDQQTYAAKEYAKRNIQYNGSFYDNSFAWVYHYFRNMTNEALANLLKTYKKYKKKAHAKNERFLSDLLP